MGENNQKRIIIFKKMKNQNLILAKVQMFQKNKKLIYKNKNKNNNLLLNKTNQMLLIMKTFVFQSDFQTIFI